MRKNLQNFCVIYSNFCECVMLVLECRHFISLEIVLYTYISLHKRT